MEFKEDLIIYVRNADEFLNIQKYLFSKDILWKHFYKDLLSGDCEFPRYIRFNYKFNNIINMISLDDFSYDLNLKKFKSINAIEILRKEKLKKIKNENTI